MQSVERQRSISGKKKKITYRLLRYLGVVCWKLNKQKRGEYKRKRRKTAVTTTNIRHRNVALPSLGCYLLITNWFAGDKTNALHLTLVVESDDSGEVVRVSLLALLNLIQDLSGVSAPEHG